MSPADVERYHWLASQVKWHAERMKVRRGWHYSQVRHYNAVIRHLPGLYTWLVSEAFRKHGPRLLANITKNNALYARLRGTA
jgi:hypothetical protein